jgi:hypothetical protein
MKPRCPLLRDQGDGLQGNQGGLLQGDQGGALQEDPKRCTARRSKVVHY